MASERGDRRFQIFGLKQAWEWEPRRSHLLKFGFDVRRVAAEYDYDGNFVTYDPLFTTDGQPWVVARDLRVEPDGVSLVESKNTDQNQPIEPIRPIQPLSLAERVILSTPGWLALQGKRL